MILIRRIVPLLSSLVLLAACDLPSSVGDHTRIVAAIPESQRAALEPAIAESLEPRSFTVRNERIFDVAHVDPADADWVDFRKVRQVLVVGEAADPWVSPALDRVDGAIPRAPAVLQAQNVWARPQVVTILLLPPGSQPSVAAERMPEVGRLYVSQLEEYARSRMYVSGEQTELADSLSRIAGFSLRVPRVYRTNEPEVGVFVFRNDLPDPSQLIRQVTVARRPSGEVEMTPAAALQWRSEVASRTTTPPQLTDSLQSGVADLTVGDRPAVQAQATWSNPPGDWPAAGPVLTRMVDCGQHTFLVDAWLYAPGRAKYEYMVQLQTILDSFRCGGQELGARSQ